MTRTPKLPRTPEQQEARTAAHARTMAAASIFFRKLALSTVLIAIGYWAFRLIFSHQTQLATGAGMPATEAWQYPLVVEAASVGLFLVRIWWPTMTTTHSNYLWIAIGFFTLISVVGNASYVLVAEPGTITLPTELAILINSIPSLTLFIVGHIAITIVFPNPARLAAAEENRRRRREARNTRRAAKSLTSTGQTTTTPHGPEQKAPRSRPTGSTPSRPRPDVEGLPTAAELFERNEFGNETIIEIAATVHGRGKTWVADRIKEERDRRAAESETSLRAVS